MGTIPGTLRRVTLSFLSSFFERMRAFKDLMDVGTVRVSCRTDGSANKMRGFLDSGPAGLRSE
jgi:hypothetical protein